MFNFIPALYRVPTLALMCRYWPRKTRVVIMTTYGSVSDDKVGVMTILGFLMKISTDIAMAIFRSRTHIYGSCTLNTELSIVISLSESSDCCACIYSRHKKPVIVIIPTLSLLTEFIYVARNISGISNKKSQESILTFVYTWGPILWDWSKMADILHWDNTLKPNALTVLLV